MKKIYSANFWFLVASFEISSRVRVALIGKKQLNNENVLCVLHNLVQWQKMKITKETNWEVCRIYFGRNQKMNIYFCTSKKLVCRSPAYCLNLTESTWIIRNCEFVHIFNKWSIKLKKCFLLISSGSNFPLGFFLNQYNNWRSITFIHLKRSFHKCVLQTLTRGMYTTPTWNRRGKKFGLSWLICHFHNQYNHFIF